MRTLKKLLVNPLFVCGAATFFFFVLAALLLPLLMPLEPFTTNADPFLPPGRGHLLGTNNLGQDVFARLVYGLRSSLYVGLAAGAFATALGTGIGIVAGYKGGLIDNLLTLLTNLLVVIPQLIILILISNSIESRTLTLLAFFIGITAWVWVARALRAQASSLRNRDHVNIARLNGQGTATILARHILPYVFSYVFMAFVMQLGSGIFAEAALSMIGLGPQGSGFVSLGRMLNEAQANEALDSGYWWVFLPPTIIITLIIFSLYLINTAMEGVFNPRLRT